MILKATYSNEDLSKNSENTNIEIPNVFWKYYDLYRREKVSLSEFSYKSGLSEDLLMKFLNILQA